MATIAQIGDPLNRFDGVEKVTGAARYAAEHPADGLLHGFAISSAIAKGRIKEIDTSAALAVPGIVEVITHLNRPSVAWLDSKYDDDAAPPGSPLRPIYDDRIHFSGQPIALVIAETPELARYGASLIAVSYEEEPFNTDFSKALDERFSPRKARSHTHNPPDRGDPQGAFDAAPVKISGDYRLATEFHNPMEMHAATAIWEPDGKLTVYNKDQGSQNVQAYLSNVFGIPLENIRVLNPYVGGAFGSGLRPQWHVYLAVMAAKMLERSVHVVMTRQQMFTHVHRPAALQCVSLAADEHGKLTSIMIEATTATSRYEYHTEAVVKWGGKVYGCDNASFGYALVPLDTSTPGDMRAPGAATGMNLFEIAVDELAYAAGMDPLEFRMKNFSDRDPVDNVPYSSKALLAAYRDGAQRFGWHKRSQAPRSMREGKELIGWGVATGMWEALVVETTARATLHADGTLEIASAASDIGTGTYTVMAQVAADTLGVPIENIRVLLGDSDLPKSPLEGGSWMAASTGAAVNLACRALKSELVICASKVPNSPLANLSAEQIEVVDGTIRAKGQPARAVRLTDALKAAGLNSISAEETYKPSRDRNMSHYTHCAVFAEARVDGELGTIRVPRIVCAAAAGRIINPKTAGSLMIGGIVMGLGMALEEEALTDHRFGRIMNHNLAEYHVPVHADIGHIDVIFVVEPDPHVSPLGAKGVGELGIVGSAAAIANAIYHATGKRIREFPITIDKLIA